MDISTIETTHTDKEACRGLVFRAHRHDFLVRGSEWDIGTNVWVEFVFELSCSGCPSCGFLEEELKEILEGYRDVPYFPMDHLEDGKLYRLEVVNSSTDIWGNVDEIELGFVKMN